MKRITLSFALIGLMCIAGLGQTNSAPLITAGHSGNNIRLAAANSVSDIKAEVVAENGVVLYEA
ncbi:MAG TPA: hypothetical protein VL501_02730, partial [Pyrinomonadaceae bacterium]|nr:hypothetical protein [Pyrinomonadaceae bacterium]